MRKLAIAAVCVVLGLTTASAQKATDDHAGTQLGFYIGRWTEEGQSRATPTGAFGKLTGEETCAWFSGGPSIVCRETTQDTAGETDAIYILAYDAVKKVYTVYGTDNAGTIYAGTGTLDKDVWRWNAELRAGAVVTPLRYTFRPAGSGSRTMDVEVATGKGTFAKIVGVTYKRAAAPAR